jgi:lipopolysaccharide export system protein LptA
MNELNAVFGSVGCLRGLGRVGFSRALGIGVMTLGLLGADLTFAVGESVPSKGGGARSLNLGPAPDFGGAFPGSGAGKLSLPGESKSEGGKSRESKEGRAAVRRGTEITSQGGLNYDPAESKAVFTGSVQVLHPVFDLSCDSLTAYLNRSKAPTAFGGGPSGEPSPNGEASKNGEKGFAAPSALSRAVAEGQVVISQEKRNEKGELERSVGRAQRVVYESSTGDITLSGWPRVEQKQNLIVALEESTVMVLNRTGRVEVKGQSKTVLRDSKIED